MGSTPRIIAIDWSGALKGSERTIFLAEVADGRVSALEHGRTRDGVTSHLIETARRDPNLIVGIDFAFSLPQWFLQANELATAPELWELATREAERWLEECETPFWGRPGTSRPALPEHFRRTDLEVPATNGIRPKSVFQIAGAGTVGTGSLRGMPVLRRLREAGFAVWPFDAPRLPMVIEIYPRILTGEITKSSSEERIAYLSARFPDLDSTFRVKAASSDDAFDALLSAVEMGARVDELLALPLARDDQDLREGRVWVPRVLPATTTARRVDPVRIPPSPKAAVTDPPLRTPPASTKSASGVLLADDFRSNLLVDRFDPILATMRGSKRSAMRSENSEDVLTWNVLRALRRAKPSLWLPVLAKSAFGLWGGFASDDATIELWQALDPPASLRRFQKDEGPTEVDVMIETDSFVWTIEAKYRSDISLRTTNNEQHDQVLRNLDVGSHYAGVRKFYFSLLVLDRDRAGEGGARLTKYAQSRAAIREALPHRVDGLENLASIGLLDWSDMLSALDAVTADDSSVDAWSASSVVSEWLRKKLRMKATPAGDDSM